MVFCVDLLVPVCDLGVVFVWYQVRVAVKRMSSLWKLQWTWYLAAYITQQGASVIKAPRLDKSRSIILKKLLNKLTH